MTGLERFEIPTDGWLDATIDAKFSQLNTVLADFFYKYKIDIMQLENGNSKFICKQCEKDIQMEDLKKLFTTPDTLIVFEGDL